MPARSVPRCAVAVLLPCAALAACAPPLVEVAESEGESLLPAAIAPPFDGPAWIAFADRGVYELDPVARAAALAAADSSLAPAARARRALATGGDGSPGTADLPIDASYLQAIADLGLEIRVASRRLNAVSVAALGPQREAVLALPFVRSVRPVARPAPRSVELDDAPMAPPPAVPDAPASAPRDESSHSPGPAPWDAGVFTDYAAAVGADALHSVGLTGDGVVVAITDTGWHFQNGIVTAIQDQVAGAWDFIQDDAEVDDEEGDDPQQARHGTLVLSALSGDEPGTLVGVAPGATFLLAKTERVVLEDAIEEDWWIAGAEWAEQAGAQLLSVSLGWIDWYSAEDLDGATAVSTVFAESLASEAGLPILVAAGNLGPGDTSITAPADAPSVIAVGATSLQGGVATFSGRGPAADGRIKPDLAAPGESVPVAVWDADEGATLASGTSLATPIVAGLCALLLEAHPDWTREELTAALLASASNAATPDNELGAGTPDGWAACGLVCSCHDADADGFFDASCGGDDCDDSDAARSPSASETCNGLDDDCDGAPLADEADADGDGDRPCASDCDDLDPTREGLDHDGDGVSLCEGDCADGDPGRAPGLEEIPYDGIDQDCDGADLVDRDGDGYDGGPDGEDCLDTDPAVFPDPSTGVEGAPTPLSGGHELCFDGLDNDCDGAFEQDDPDCQPAPAASNATSSDSSSEISSSGCSFDVAGGGGAGAARRAAALALVPLLLLPLVSARRRT